MNYKKSVLECFHCNEMIYDIGKLYDYKWNGVLYCTNCNICIKNQFEVIEDA